MSELFAVVLASEDQFRAPEVAKAIAAFRGILPFDAGGEARRCWGVVAEDLSAEDAARLLSCLEQGGLNGKQVPVAALGGKPNPLTFVKCQTGPAGFRAAFKDGTSQEVRWPDVVVLSATVFRETHSRTLTHQEGPSAGQQALSMGITLATGIPIHLGPKKQTVKKTLEEIELRLVFDVIAGPERRWFRVEGLAFDYSVLGADKEPAAINNFRKLILRFAAHATAARLGRGAVALLKNQPLTSLGYERVADLERESRWLFALGPRAI